MPHVLRVADISDPDHLNPYFSTMDLTYALTSLVYSYLVVADDNGRLQGDLIAQVPSLANGGISADGKTYTYRLRPGVRWHDGAPLTSADVKFSWQAVMNPRNNTFHREGYDQVASIDTPDAQTVVVHLQRRYPPFVTQFFAPLQEGGKGILPQHLLGKYASLNEAAYNAAPVGSGPFKFVKWERGRQIVFARNDAYYRGKPKLERIVFSIIPDDNTILNEVRLHHIDMVVSPPGVQYDRYKSLDGVSATLSPWNAQGIFIMNESHAGISDLQVRRAMTMAIDYDGLIEKVTHGVGERAYDIVPPTAIGYTKNEPYRYDPAKANALLDAAGYKRGADGVRAKGGTRLDYTMAVISGSANQHAVSVQLQAMFAAVGMRLALKSYPYNTIFAPDGPIYGGSYDFAEYSMTMPWDPNLRFYLGCDKFYPAGENVYRYCNHEVDRLEAAGLASDDPAVREGVYHRAQPLIHASVPYVSLYEVRRVLVHSADLHHFAANPTGTPWFNAWEWDI